MLYQMGDQGFTSWSMAIVFIIDKDFGLRFPKITSIDGVSWWFRIVSDRIWPVSPCKVRSGWWIVARKGLGTSWHICYKTGGGLSLIWRWDLLRWADSTLLINVANIRDFHSIRFPPEEHCYKITHWNFRNVDFTLVFRTLSRKKRVKCGWLRFRRTNRSITSKLNFRNYNKILIK